MSSKPARINYKYGFLVHFIFFRRPPLFPVFYYWIITRERERKKKSFGTRCDVTGDVSNFLMSLRCHANGGHGAAGRERSWRRNKSPTSWWMIASLFLASLSCTSRREFSATATRRCSLLYIAAAAAAAAVRIINYYGHTIRQGVPINEG
jgi:hypothetical protein